MKKCIQFSIKVIIFINRIGVGIAEQEVAVLEPDRSLGELKTFGELKDFGIEWHDGIDGRIGARGLTLRAIDAMNNVSTTQVDAPVR